MEILLFKITAKAQAVETINSSFAEYHSRHMAGI